MCEHEDAKYLLQQFLLARFTFATEKKAQDPKEKRFDYFVK